MAQGTRRLTRRRLVEVLGEDLALDLMRDWGGHQLPTHSDSFVARVARDRVIRRRAERESYDVIAGEAGLSARQARRIANGETRH